MSGHTSKLRQMKRKFIEQIMIIIYRGIVLLTILSEEIIGIVIVTDNTTRSSVVKVSNMFPLSLITSEIIKV